MPFPFFDSLLAGKKLLREKALAVSTPEVPEDEVWFFCHGTVPNVTGAPVINEFYAARSRYVQKKDPEQPDELGDLAMVKFLVSALLNNEVRSFPQKAGI
ncbi:hypothetical protein [Succinimonas sp.]|uniref:hypothetical protein n=1 Tax=Succinimonas sp. TaxID=1936151 RepID=UPI00387029EC